MRNLYPAPAVRPDARLVDSRSGGQPASRLRLVGCHRALAAEAVARWHYSRSLAAVTVDQFAVYEDDRFIGAIVFGPGPRRLPLIFGCGPREVCELMRVALDTHTTPVSRIVAIAIRLLRIDRPGLRLMVSYADTAQGHHGGIYQAGGWTYAGLGSLSSSEYVIDGRVVHGRTVGAHYPGHGRNRLAWIRANVDPHASVRRASPKHRYFLGYDAEMQRRIAALQATYPKRAKQAMAGFPSVQRQGGTDPHAPSSIAGAPA